MVFKLVMAASKTWRRLNRYEHLPRVIQGVKFTDGIQADETETRAADLAARLQEYFAFRHVSRNVYGYLMDAERIRALEERLPETLDTFEEQVRAFLGWMAGADDR